MHEAMATTLDVVIEDIKRIQHEARVNAGRKVRRAAVQ
jgi:phosphoketolase